MNKRFQLSMREFGFLLIAVSALAFAWMGTVNAGGPNTPQAAMQFAGADDDHDFDDEDDDHDFDDEDDWIDEEEMMFESIAKAIGVDIDTLFNELDNGKSIADVANANNVDPQTIIDLLIAEETAFIDELLAAGEISQTEADEWKAESAQFTPFMVNSVYTDPDVVAAQLIGIDVETLRTELYDNGSTIKAVAEANNVDPQTIIDAIIASEDASVDEMLAAGVITDAEAAEWKAENTEFAAEIVNEGFDYDCDEADEMHDDDETEGAEGTEEADEGNDA